MKRTILFSLLFLIATNCYSAEVPCAKLVDIIEESRKHDGVVFPLDSSTVRMFVQLKLLPKTALNSPESFYAEDRGINKFRVFNMQKGCAQMQWFFPSDFLYLLGLRKA